MNNRHGFTAGVLPRLRERFADCFPIGAAVGARHLEKHGSLIAEQFSSLTAENCMKPESLQPREGEFDFREADILVNFAQKHGMKMRGHCLVWHNQTPDWVFRDPADPSQLASRELLMDRMVSHIQTVMEHFKGSVYCWDVVNEAVADKESGLLRNTPWLRGIGSDWVAQAFRCAREADGDALLFYNDYNETEQPKLSKITGFLDRLRAEGVPIDGMGLQGHFGPSWPSIEELKIALNAYKALGLILQITELDVSVYRWNHGPSSLRYTTSEMLISQTARYRELFSLFLERRADLSGITLWGVTDDGSWLNNFPEPNRPNWPLLFDEMGKPKPAFQEIIGLV